MIFRQRLQYHLVKLLKCSNKQAIEYCQNGLIFIDNKIEIDPLLIILDHQSINFQDQEIRSGFKLRYILFHKPFGYECTSNLKIIENIYELLPLDFQSLFTLGRLDKNSSGLLLLTNDGKIYHQMVDLGTEIEKEYLVTTFNPITKKLIDSFKNQFQLGPRITLPAKIDQIDDFNFKVILKEGINRQIRRICAKNENQVKNLVRIRFGNHILSDIKPGEWCEINSF